MAEGTPLDERIVAALTDAGYDHAHHNEPYDGFVVARPKGAGDAADRIAVVPVFHGVLSRMGTPGVRARWVGQFAGVLREAGFGTVLVPSDHPDGRGLAAAVMVADTQETADRAVAELPGAGRG